MRVFVRLSLPTVKLALDLVVSKFGHTVVQDGSEAELVITDVQSISDAAFRARKRVIELIVDPRGYPRPYIANDVDGFGVRQFQVVAWFPDIPVAEDMYVYLRKLVDNDERTEDDDCLIPPFANPLGDDGDW